MIHGAQCDCLRCRVDVEAPACVVCGDRPLGGPGDEPDTCRQCARAIADLVRDERERSVEG